MDDPFERRDRIESAYEIMRHSRSMPAQIRKMFMMDVLRDEDLGALPDSEDAYIPRLMKLPTEKLFSARTGAELVAQKQFSYASSVLTEEQRLDYLGRVQSLRDEIKADQDLNERDRTRILKLLQQLEEALNRALTHGSDAVETAAKAVVGEFAMNRALWGWLASKRKWAKDTVVTVSSLVVLLDASGGAYSGMKEIREDIISHQPAIIATQQHQPDEPVILDADAVPEDVESPSED